MKYRISRASDYSGNSPCPSAIKEDGSYFITINTLEDLMKFVKENGEIVLDDESIKIYDDYLE
jgi:hypothetical protein